MIYDIELNSAAHYPVRDIVELSPQIEAAGFGAFWKGESNSTDPVVLLSAIAARRGGATGRPEHANVTASLRTDSNQYFTSSPLCGQ